MYITDEMRQTYNIPSWFHMIVDYGTFVQSEWNEWAIIKIEGLMFAAVK